MSVKLLFQKKSVPRERRHSMNEGRIPVFSYYARRSAVPGVEGRQLFRPTVQAGQAARVLRYCAKRFGVIAALAAVIVGLWSTLTLSANPRILPLEPSQRTYLRNEVVYERAAKALFASSIMNQTKLTIDTEGISSALKRQFPELAAVSINLPLIDRNPIVYIQPTEAALELHTLQGASFVVDEHGQALAEAKTVSSDVSAHLPLLKDESGAEITTGKQALPTSIVSFILAAQFQFAHKGVSAASYVLPAGKSELDVNLSGLPYYVRFNLADNSIQQQVGTFLSVRHYLQEKGVTPAQYIDVRVDGRAYYK